MLQVLEPRVLHNLCRRIQRALGRYLLTTQQSSTSYHHHSRFSIATYAVDCHPPATTTFPSIVVITSSPSRRPPPLRPSAELHQGPKTLASFSVSEPKAVKASIVCAAPSRRSSLRLTSLSPLTRKKRIVTCCCPIEQTRQLTQLISASLCYRRIGGGEQRRPGFYVRLRRHVSEQPPASHSSNLEAVGHGEGEEIFEVIGIDNICR